MSYPDHPDTKNFVVKVVSKIDGNFRIFERNQDCPRGYTHRCVECEHYQFIAETSDSMFRKNTSTGKMLCSYYKATTISGEVMRRRNDLKYVVSINNQEFGEYEINSWDVEFARDRFDYFYRLYWDLLH